jgi:hypothetical protein
MKTMIVVAGALVLVLAVRGTASAQEPADNFSFFITSENPGTGANFGGLDGADAHCQELAAAVGAGDKTWRAYLSTTGAGAVNARDRIGSGPWSNVSGVQIAASVADLHSDNNNLNKETALGETGQVLNGVGDEPNRHDILTGSNADGTASDMTCNNWTDETDGSAASVGHFDRVGGGAAATSWNASHNSRGCSLENLRASGGEGYLYCFAID